MMVELADTVNSQDECVKSLTDQIILFPAPATKWQAINLCESVWARDDLRFPCIHRRQFRPGSVHSENISPLMNHVAVPS
jgi:hypothetical protein